MKSRYQYGELKKLDLCATTIRLPKDLMRRLDALRGGKSWSVWLAEVEAKLSGQS